MHIDADEALFPADSPTMDIRQVLSAVPPHIDRVVFPNHEAVPEGGKDSDPTTLFRKNHRTVGGGVHAICEPRAWFQSKLLLSVREWEISRSHQRRERSTKRTERTDSCPRAVAKRPPLEAVLHFPFRDASRAAQALRCACADADLCSMLPFDRLLVRAARERPENFDAFFDAAVVERNESKNGIDKAGLYARIHAVDLTLRR